MAIEGVDIIKAAGFIGAACSTRRITNLIKLLFLLNDNYRIPSFTPKEYKFQESLPLVTYKILFQLSKELNYNKFQNLNIPTKVMVDKKDELVSSRILKKQIKRYDLDEWDLITLTRKKSTLKYKYHHLIVDRVTFGPKLWDNTIKDIIAFLKA